MKKRLFALCLALTMAASAVSCGDSDDSSKSKSKKDKADSSSVVESESAVDSNTIVESPADDSKFDASKTYYAYDNEQTTVLEIKDGKFTVVSTIEAYNASGTVESDGKLMTADGEIKYFIKEGHTVFTYPNGKGGHDLKFVSANEYSIYAPKIKSDATKKPETTTAPTTSAPDDLSEPAVTTPAGTGDDSYDPNKHHVPLPQVDVTGKNWTQTPDGWLDEAKGSAAYKYFNKDKWSEYTGENNPNFPNGDPAVEWAFFGTDCEFRMLKDQEDNPYTYAQLAKMLEYTSNPEEYNEEYIKAHPEIVEECQSLTPNVSSASLHLYTRKPKDTGNDLDDYVIDYDINVIDDDGNAIHYSGSIGAKDLAMSSTDKYSYSLDDGQGRYFYWTIYPYEAFGYKLMNLRVIDNNKKISVDRIYWSQPEWR